MPAQNVTVTATFDDAPAGTYNISGTITGDVLAGVTVAVDTTHSATTDVSGNYTISGLADGTYTVTPSLSGYTFNPATASATVSGANVTGIDFTATADVVNNSPVAKNDSFNVKVDTMLTVNKPGVLANDYDLENAQLTAFIVTQTTNGTLTFVNDGSFSYQPNNGFTGTDSFTYKVSDGELDSNTATVTLTVYNANTNIPPNALDDDYAMATNSELTVDAESGVLANDTDLNDADTLTAEIGTMPLQGTLVFNTDGSFTYTPEEDFVGIVEFTYTALDNNGARSGVATVQIDVKPFNITIGSPVTVLATEVLTDEKFVKIPKIYGMVDGKKASLKKVKAQFTPDKAVGIWSRKVTLYDKKALKNGYAAYFENGDPQKPKNIQIKVKMKTQAKEKIDVDVKVAMLVPPVFESFQIKDDIITEASAGASIIINGKYFGEKIPKVALVIDNKLVKCKVDKNALIYKNYKGKPSPMEPETGISRLTVVLPVKKVNPGTYDVIIDNKIGIATDANEALPKIIIK
jgi:VCBS repeat-containing protein